MQLYTEKKECCGCLSCYNICPKNAISVFYDEYGCIYPQINADECINCEACKRVCPIKHTEKLEQNIKSYVAATVSTDIMKSASGGVFASFASAILKEDGIVFGCEMEFDNDTLFPKHAQVDDEKQLVKLLGSKYVQSYMGHVYVHIRKLLEQGRTVLFAGTPCQVSALRLFLGKEYNNLLTMDLICHGVPGTKYFQDYLKLLEKKIGGKITKIDFRDKSSGWGLNGKIYYLKTGKTREKVLFEKESSYYSFFLRQVTYRESCYFCPYAGRKRVGDITIGDYWGVEKEHPDILYKDGFDLKKGVSCLLVNTEKGMEALRKFKDGLLLNTTTIDQVATWNNQLNTPSKKSEIRDDVINAYRCSGYMGVEKCFSKEHDLKWVINYVKRRIPQSIKRCLKMHKS